MRVSREPHHGWSHVCTVYTPRLDILTNHCRNPWLGDITGGLGVYRLRNQPEIWSVFFNWSTAHDHADKLMCIRIYANFKGIAGSFERSFADVTGLLFAWYLVGKVDLDRKSTRLNSSHVAISYAVFCLNK